MWRCVMCIGVLVVVSVALWGCSQTSPDDPPEVQEARTAMVERLRTGGLVTDKRVLEALGTIPRHRLLDRNYWSQAYTDQAMTIDGQRVLSPPVLSGSVVQNLNPMSKHRILVITPLTGYEVALLGRLCSKVVVIVFSESDCVPIRADVEALGGGANVEIHACDVSSGWGPAAPYDAVLMYSESGNPPNKVLEQMKGNAVCVQYNGPWAGRVVVHAMKDGELMNLRTVAIQ